MLRLSLQFFAEEASRASVDTFYASETGKEAFLAQTRIDQEKTNANGLNLVFDKNQQALAKEYEQMRLAIAEKFDQIRARNEQMQQTDDPAKKAQLWAEIQQLIRDIKEMIARLMSMLRDNGRQERGHLFGHPGVLKNMAEEMSDYHEYMMDFADAAMDKMDELGEDQKEMKAELKQNMKDLNKELKESQKEIMEALMAKLDEKTESLKSSYQEALDANLKSQEDMRGRLSMTSRELAEQITRKAYLEANLAELKSKFQTLPKDSIAIGGDKYNYIITPSALNAERADGEQTKAAIMIIQDNLTGERLDIRTEAELARFLKNTTDPLFADAKNENTALGRMIAALSHTEDSLAKFENAKASTVMDLLDVGRLLEEKSGIKDANIRMAISYLEKMIVSPCDLGREGEGICEALQETIDAVKGLSDHLPQIAEQYSLTSDEAKHIGETLDRCLDRMNSSLGRDEYYKDQRAELSAAREFYGENLISDLVKEVQSAAKQNGQVYTDVEKCLEDMVDRISTIIENTERKTEELERELKSTSQSIDTIKEEYREVEEKTIITRNEFEKIKDPTKEDEQKLRDEVFKVESRLVALRLDQRGDNLPSREFLKAQAEKFQESFGEDRILVIYNTKDGLIKVKDKESGNERNILYEGTSLYAVYAKDDNSDSRYGDLMYTVESTNGQREMTSFNDKYIHEIGRTLEIAEEKSKELDTKNFDNKLKDVVLEEDER